MSVDALKYFLSIVSISGLRQPKGIFILNFLLTAFVILLIKFLGLNLNIAWLSSGTAVFWIISYIIWFIDRIYIFPKKDNINVVLAVEAPDDSLELLKKVSKRISSNLKEIKGLSFDTIDISGRRLFVKDEEAEAYTRNEGIHLLIWGQIDTGRVRDKEIAIFKPKFTYNFNISGRNLTELEEKRLRFLNNLKSAVSGRTWDIPFSESLPHTQIVTQNFSEVALYIVSKCLISFGAWDKAEACLLGLKANLTGSDLKNNFPRLVQFRQEVNKTLIQLWTLLADYYFHNLKDEKRAQIYSENILKYDSKNFYALIQMAFFNWKKGNKDLSRHYNIRAERAFPSNDLVRINKAFFALVDEDFGKAHNLYLKIRDIPQGTRIFDTILFLEDEYEKTKDPVFLFGSGYLNSYFGDPKRGGDLLNKFVTLVKDDKRDGIDKLINISVIRADIIHR